MRLASFVVASAGCDKSEESVLPAETDADTDTDTDADTDTDTDTDSDTDADSDTEPEPDPCEGYAPWDPAGSGVGRMGDLAGDLTFTTTAGEDLRLSEIFDGCSSVMVLMYDSFNPYATANWGNGLAPIVWTSPEQVHYVVVSASDDEEDRLEEVTSIETDLNDFLGLYGEETQDHWAERVHFVTDDANTLGWLGDVAALAIPVGGDLVPMFAVGVDRRQRIRQVGATLDWSTGLWEPAFLGYEAAYYEFELARELELAAGPEVVEVTIFDHEAINDSGWAGVRGTADVVLPDLTAFDTMEFDLELSCADADGDSVLECPEWDRETMGYLCDADDGDWCSWEIGRWITAYTRDGRWVHDASPLLALLGEGGTSTRFQFYTVDPYVVTWTLRLSNQGRGVRPTWWSPGFVGGALDEAYDANHPPITVEPPADVVGLDLYTILSGHGSATDTLNCAEFCNHEHHFTIGGTTWSKVHEEAGTSDGCENDVSNGTVPNQWGSWPFGRAGWCPGKDVVPWVADLTPELVAGEGTPVSYTVTVDGAPYVPVYTGGGDYYPTIKLQSYFVGWTPL